MKKKIKRRQLERKEKIKPHESSDKPPLSEYPAFSLYYEDREYGLNKCTKEEKAAFADKISKLSQRKWGEIINSPGIGCTIFKDNSQLTRPIPPHISPDVKLIEIHFQGNKPMLGYREGSIFYVIFFDPKFALYKH